MPRTMAMTRKRTRSSSRPSSRAPLFLERPRFLREPRRERFVPLQTRHLPRRVPVAVRAQVREPQPAAREKPLARVAVSLHRRFVHGAVSVSVQTVRSTPTSRSTRTSRPTRSRAAPPTARRCTRTRSWRARRTSRHAPAKRARPRSRARRGARVFFSERRRDDDDVGSSLPVGLFPPAPPPRRTIRTASCRRVSVRPRRRRTCEPATDTSQAPVPRRPVNRGAAILFLRAPRVFAQNVHQVRARLQKAASGGPVQGARAVRVHGRVARGVPARVRDERAQSGKVPVARQAQAERQTVARARFFLCDGTGKNARVVCTVGVFTHRRLRRTSALGARRLGANEHDERVPGTRRGRVPGTPRSSCRVSPGNARADLCRLVKRAARTAEQQIVRSRVSHPRRGDEPNFAAEFFGRVLFERSRDASRDLVSFGSATRRSRYRASCVSCVSCVSSFTKAHVSVFDSVVNPSS